MVVDVSNDNRVATLQRQVGRPGRSLEYGYIRKPFLLDVVANRNELALADISGEHAPAADPLAEDHGRGAETGTHIGHGHPRLQIEDIHKLRQFKLRLPTLLGHLLRIGQLRAQWNGH